MQAIKRILLVFICLSAATVLFAQNKGDSPVAMDEIYDDLLVKWKNRLASTDDCTSTNDGLVKASDSVYISRLHSLPTRMELAFNDIVRGHIEMYAGRRRNQVSYMLGETAHYFPLFENILDKEGVPLELKYLPIIESALNPIARSRVGASGLWQFMAATGRIYGLEVNSLVDERLDPAKSTAAAARYLKDMYKIYGDWNLVIAAYNCGPGNVNKAIRRSGGKTDYWAIYPYLPRETRGYVPAFIAATYIMNYYEEHGICPVASPYPASIDTLSIDKNIHFEQIAGVLNIGVDEIRKYNPQFKNDIIPGEYKTYMINLPFNHIAGFISNEDSILAYRNTELLSHRKTVTVAGSSNTVAKGSGKVHRVKQGDTLSLIASKYGVTVRQLREWNDLRNDRLTIGRRISIYSKTSKPSVTIALTQPSATGGDITTKEVVASQQYKVKKGDTWTSVAKKHNVTVDQLKQWNKKATKSLIAGLFLTIQTVSVVEVEEPVKLLSEPQLMVVKIDPNYTASLIGNYLDNMEREDSNVPTTSLSFNETEERPQIHSNRFLYHKVKVGESINQIATRYRVSTDDIVSWNKLSNTSTRIGQRLLIYLPETNNSRANVARSATDPDLNTAASI